MEFHNDTLQTSDAFPPVKQKIWDRPLIEKDLAEITEHAEGLTNRARLEAACSPHSVDWLFAVPVAAFGLALDNELVRVAVGLRLGLDLCA